MKTYVIAEIGSCHDGDLEKARWLVRIAAACGADAVKLQYWSDADALAARRRVPDAYRDIYRRYQMPADWLPILQTTAQGSGVDLVCTSYLPQDVAVIAPYVRHFKIASFEAEALDLWRAHVPFVNADRWLVVSEGMSTGECLPCELLDDCPALVAALRTLYCVSAYPAPTDALRLQNIRQHDGFSDHSDPAQIATGALAYAAGAGAAGRQDDDAPFIVERHLRLPYTDPVNPDAPHAMMPDGFAEYVRLIRFAEQCFQPGSGMHDSERAMAAYKVRT